MDMTAFSTINKQRSMKFMNGPLEQWTESDWAVAGAGEMGEVCDGIKKLNRMRMGVHSNNVRSQVSEADMKKHILKEIGDTVTYLDLLAQRMGSDVESCLRAAFNSVSQREGLEERI
jgi:NTP pyrophosphatase (non-canonical NTP hydrolase)